MKYLNKFQLMSYLFFLIFITVGTSAFTETAINKNMIVEGFTVNVFSSRLTQNGLLIEKGSIHLFNIDLSVNGLEISNTTPAKVINPIHKLESYTIQTPYGSGITLTNLILELKACLRIYQF